MHDLERVKILDVAKLLIGGQDATNPVIGLASGYKLARGVSSVTGTLAVVTGLTTIIAVVATLKDDVSLAGTDVSATWTGGSATLKVWKPTATGDCTPIAATAAKDVSWVAIGT